MAGYRHDTATAERNNAQISGVPWSCVARRRSCAPRSRKREKRPAAGRDMHGDVQKKSGVCGGKYWRFRGVLGFNTVHTARTRILRVLAVFRGSLLLWILPVHASTSGVDTAGTHRNRSIFGFRIVDTANTGGISAVSTAHTASVLSNTLKLSQCIGV